LGGRHTARALAAPDRPDIWALETEDGRPVECCGPVDVHDVDLMLLPHLNYSTRDVGFLQGEWRPYVPSMGCKLTERPSYLVPGPSYPAWTY
jgi:hypothetical protein